MTSRKKKLVVEGFTIHTLTSGGIFKEHVCEVFEDMYNEVKVNFCSKRRYDQCSKDKECFLCRPTKETSARKFLNLPESGDWILHKSECQRKIHQKLYRIWRKCRPIRITVEEGEK